MSEYRKLYPEMYEYLASLFYRHDPMKLDDLERYSYSVEAEGFIPRLNDLLDTVDPRETLRGRSAMLQWSDIRDGLHAEFHRWFGDEAGLKTRYEAIAQEIYGVIKEIEKGVDITGDKYTAAVRWE